jgi:hypothetical protein
MIAPRAYYVAVRPLLSLPALGAVALLAFNDLWLKRWHPGVVSGKLSDVALVVLMPLAAVALLEWASVLARKGALLPSRHLDTVGTLVALAYFVAVKAWPTATELHLRALGALLPRWHYRAVTDPTDLACLPFALVAWGWLRARRRAATALAPAAS